MILYYEEINRSMLATDYYCKRAIQPDQKSAMAMAAGYAGGFMATAMMG